MNLVVQGSIVDPGVIEKLAAISGAQASEKITPLAYRLRDAHADERIAEICRSAALDWAWLPAGRRLSDYTLFVTDMDSTLITAECIDEIADLHGLKAKVAAITEAAMRGEIDFAESLRRRVELLAGLPETALEAVYRHRILLSPGAERLMAALKQAEVHTMLVSGGFTYFTERLRARLGFDEAYGNTLEIRDGHLTGRVTGAVVDSAAKLAHLNAAARRLGAGRDQILAVGDGANDIDMIAAAGLGIAYHAKPALRRAARYHLDHVGLDGIVNFFA